MAYELMEFDTIPWTPTDDARADVALPTIPEQLSEKGQRVLRANARLRGTWDETRNTYRSPSERAYALAYYAGYAGLTVEDASWLLSDLYSRPGKKKLNRSKLSKTLRAWQKGREEAGQHEGTSGAYREPEAGPPAAASPSTMVTAHLTDTGNAQRLAALYGDRFRWCAAWACFLVWDGRRWMKDDGGQIVRWAKDTVAGIYGEAADMADEVLRKEFYRHALRSENDARLRGMLHLVQSEPGIPIRPEALDCNQWLWNATNGTVDLRTGQLREHRPSDLISKLCPVDFDPHAEAPTWQGFLGRIFDGKADLIDHMQRAFGYALTGSIREQCWHLLYGTGENGKSTLLRTVIDLCGDYATWTPTQTLLARKYEGIENDLARLRGARIVAAVETGDGRRLAEALLKQMTGGDGITARFLYSEYFTFTPEFKLFLATNHKPTIRGTDRATWRRVRLVPFTVTIPEEEQDGDMPDKLRSEFPGILRWLVDGCLAWQQMPRLGMPDAIRQATEEYRASMDVVSEFFKDRCERDDKARTSARHLYASYVEWCGKEHPESQRRFGEALAEKGFTRTRGNRGEVVWAGLRLISEPSEDSEPLFGKFKN